jgi:hypothetical protein
MYKNIFKSDKQLTVVSYDAIFGETVTPREFILHHDADTDVLAMAKEWLAVHTAQHSTPRIRYTVPLQTLTEFETKYTTNNIQFYNQLDLDELVKGITPKAKDTLGKATQSVNGLYDKFKHIFDTASENTLVKDLKDALTKSSCPVDEDVPPVDEDVPVIHTYILTTPQGDREIKATGVFADEFAEQFTVIIGECGISALESVKVVVEGGIKIIATTEEEFAELAGIHHITLVDGDIDHNNKYTTTLEAPEYSYDFVVDYTHEMLGDRRQLIATSLEVAKQHLFKQITLGSVESVKLEGTTDPRIKG